MGLMLAYVIWCGFCWLLRGGKFGAIYRALFGREPGTTVTRIGCAILMAVPLAFVDPAYALLAVSIFGAMTLGYFGEAMGLDQPGRDHAFLALWGFTVAFVMLLPLAYLVSPWALAWAPVGSLAVAAYHFNKPLGRRYGTDWTERAEFLTGAAMGAALYAGAL